MKRRPLWIALGVVLVLVAAGGFATWYFVLRDTAPPAASIEDAAESAESESGGKQTTALDGTWTLDTSIGSFTDFTSAFVGYRVREELVDIGAGTAYGRTPDVDGTLTVEGTKVTATAVDADRTTLQSDKGFRDNAIRSQALETDTFPTASFELTEPIDLGKVPKEGERVSVDATGSLTLHGVTREVTIPLEARLVGDTIAVTSLFDIEFADYDIERPSAASVLSVEDRGQMDLQLFFTRQ